LYLAFETYIPDKNWHIVVNVAVEPTISFQKLSSVAILSIFFCKNNNNDGWKLLLVILSM
jgi:hypothetical protein